MHNGSCAKGEEVDICVMQKGNGGGVGVNYSASTRSVYFELSQSLPFDVKVILPVTEHSGRGNGSTDSHYSLDDFVIVKGSTSSQERTYEDFNTCDYNREFNCGYSEYEIGDPYIDQPEVQYGNVTYKLSFCSEGGAKPIDFDPSCGTAHGTKRTTAPTTEDELCSDGWMVNWKSSPYGRTWECSNGKDKATCQTEKISKIDGKCNNSRAYACSAGASIDNKYNYSKYTWKCRGTNGGSTVECSKCEPDKEVLARCEGRSGQTRVQGSWNYNTCDCDCPDGRQVGIDGACPDDGSTPPDQGEGCLPGDIVVPYYEVYLYQDPYGDYNCNCLNNGTCCCGL